MRNILTPIIISNFCAYKTYKYCYKSVNIYNLEVLLYNRIINKCFSYVIKSINLRDFIYISKVAVLFLEQYSQNMATTVLLKYCVPVM